MNQQIFKTRLNNSFEFEFNKEEIENLDIISISESKYHVLHNNKSYFTEVSQSNFNEKSYQIKVNNTIHEVKISDQLDDVINSMGFTIGGTKQINSVKAPMPGLILEINVEVGQDIEENDQLLILEAMKMENIITAPRSGKIKSIEISKGNPVDKNALLIELE